MRWIIWCSATLFRRASKPPRCAAATEILPGQVHTARRGSRRLLVVQDWKEAHRFKTDSVFHLIEPDINQELYGLPEYLSALNSAWLNEAATLFRRKYYQNGAHAGYILYMTDAAQSTSDVDRMRQAMRDTKGLGNFRNLFMYAPNGKPDGIKILPLSEVATKDDFLTSRTPAATIC